MILPASEVLIGEAAAADFAAVRRLFSAYAASLPFSLEFQGFADEIADLPGPYAAPRGCLLLAGCGGVAIGVAGLKPLAAEIAEMKRLYVAPEARGRGAGRALVERLLATARGRGYRRVRLDTHRPSMVAAIAMYRAFGFVEIPPYGPNPDGEFRFFEKTL